MGCKKSQTYFFVRTKHEHFLFRYFRLDRLIKFKCIDQQLMRTRKMSNVDCLASLETLLDKQKVTKIWLQMSNQSETQS